MVGLLERISLMENAEVNSKANNKIFISSIILIINIAVGH